MLKKYLTIFFTIIYVSSFAQKKTYLLAVNKINSVKLSLPVIDASIAVLKKRLHKISSTNATVYFDKQHNNFVIETIDEMDEAQINSRLIKQYKASIFECYNISEFLSLIQINKSKKLKILSDDFVKNYVLPTTFKPAYVGITSVKNISIANKNKLALQQQYSKSLQLMYGKKEIQENDDVVELYALKNNSSVLDINKTLDSASIGFDAMGHPSLQLVFDRVGTKAFEKLTKKNIDKYLAITIDELVFLAPRVMGEITEGRLEISGSFTIKELQEIKNNLISGYLPISLYLKK